MSNDVDILGRQLDVGDHVAFIRKIGNSKNLETGYIVGFTKLMVTIAPSPTSEDKRSYTNSNMVIIQKHAFDPSLIQEKVKQV